MTLLFLATTFNCFLQVKLYAISSTVERRAKDHQNKKNNVRKSSCEVNNFAAWLNALEQAKEYENPSSQVTAN